MKIKHFETETEILQCYDVIKDLRPKIECPHEFVERVQRQQKNSYRLLGIEVEGKVVAVAGYRESENLIHGPFVYIDDLVSAKNLRGHGYGSVLIKEISKIAKELGKNKVVLDTGLSNSQAQKFYYREGFLGLGMHFLREL